MNNIIDDIKPFIFQIATPFNTGTGFYWTKDHLVITNEHVVRDVQEVVLIPSSGKKIIGKIVYKNKRFDIAFIKPSQKLFFKNQIVFGTPSKVIQGDVVLAVGHPFGLDFSATQGIVSNLVYKTNNGIDYIQHDAALNPGNSGGPLLDHKGRVIGVNTFIIQNGNNVGFSLPSSYITTFLDAFNRLQSKGNTFVACVSCSNIVIEGEEEGNYCTYCGSKIEMIHKIPKYKPQNYALIIETILNKLGIDAALNRNGQDAWILDYDSNKINLRHRKTIQLTTGDVHLCSLPNQQIKPLYRYLLEENNALDGLTLSLKENQIILSLIMHDTTLTIESGYTQIQNLLEQTAKFNDLLVNRFGAIPIQ